MKNLATHFCSKRVNKWFSNALSTMKYNIVSDTRFVWRRQSVGWKLMKCLLYYCPVSFLVNFPVIFPDQIKTDSLQYKKILKSVFLFPFAFYAYCLFRNYKTAYYKS